MQFYVETFFSPVTKRKLRKFTAIIIFQQKFREINLLLINYILIWFHEIFFRCELILRNLNVRSTIFKIEGEKCSPANQSFDFTDFFFHLKWGYVVMYVCFRNFNADVQCIVWKWRKIPHCFLAKFRESNVFTKEISEELIWRKILFSKIRFLFFHTVSVIKNSFYKFSSRQFAKKLRVVYIFTKYFQVSVSSFSHSIAKRCCQCTVINVAYTNFSKNFHTVTGI